MDIAALRNVEWDEVPIQYEGKTVTVVYRRTPTTRWHPFLLVADSALLQSLGRSGNGLYAVRNFRAGDVLGRYDGTVVGVFDSRQDALESDTARRLVRKLHDKLITRSRRGGGVELVDGDTMGAPYLQMVNDPVNTRFKPNVFISPGGYMKCISAIPAFDFSKTLHENRRSELRFDYGSDYWRQMRKLGTTVEDSIIV